MYYLFTWDQYYPEGGFNDFRMCSKDLSEINRLLDSDVLKRNKIEKRYYQVIQITSDGWNVVSEG
jgi:hypothetical protein